MPSAVTILCRSVTPRLSYIARYLTSVLPVPFEVTNSNNLNSRGNYYIHYSAKTVQGEFNIYSNGFLSETDIRIFEPGILKKNHQTMLFPAPEGYNLSFDIFSAIFYMLSRYEEYLPFMEDQYGRFEADQSLAFRYKFIEDPVVEQWIMMLTNALREKFPDLDLPKRVPGFLSTIDIDNPWAYKNRGFLRNMAGMGRNIIQLKFNEVWLRLSVLTGFRADPYDVYEAISKIEDRHKFRSVIFVLSGNYGEYDTNYAMHTKSFRDLIQSLKDFRIIGIHPSFKSNHQKKLLSKEFSLFTELLGKKPIHSRQHFLMMKMPETYQNLIFMGVRHDYSMGYASMPGFRAGTCLPFKFYDLSSEKEMNLTIHPFIVMDITLRQYLGYDPETASEKIIRLIKTTREVNGTFTSLWHNESLSEKGVWKGWRKVFEQMTENAITL